MTREAFVNDFTRRMLFVLQQHQRVIAAEIGFGDGPQVRIAHDVLHAAVLEFAETTFDAIEERHPMEPAV